MKFTIILTWLLQVLYLGPVQGSLTPDAPIQINVNGTIANVSAIGQCVAAGRTFTRDVRLQKFITKANTTFVRRQVADGFATCLDESAKQLPATSFLSCSVETEKAGLKTFKFAGGACTGYPFIITAEQQGCAGSGSLVFYTTLANTAAAGRRSETGRSPAFREQGMPRVLTMSTDVIVDDDGFKGIAGKGLNTNQTYKKLEVINKCQCHYFCSSDSACNAYSVLSLGTNSLLCSLADAEVYTNTPSSVSGSYYAVKEGLVETQAIDNLIYMKLSSAAQGFAAHKAACEAIPGFRLVAVRFQAQMAILQAICLGQAPSTPTESCSSQTNWFYVDMIKVAGIPMVQGVDPLSQTDVTSININDNDSVDHFIYAHSNTLHDESATKWNTKPVCQANVYGVNW